MEHLCQALGAPELHHVLLRDLRLASIHRRQPLQLQPGSVLGAAPVERLQSSARSKAVLFPLLNDSLIWCRKALDFMEVFFMGMHKQPITDPSLPIWSKSSLNDITGQSPFDSMRSPIPLDEPINFFCPPLSTC